MNVATSSHSPGRTLTMLETLCERYGFVQSDSTFPASTQFCLMSLMSERYWTAVESSSINPSYSQQKRMTSSVLLADHTHGSQACGFFEWKYWKTGSRRLAWTMRNPRLNLPRPAPEKQPNLDAELPS